MGGQWPVVVGCPIRLLLSHVLVCVLSLLAFASYPCLEFVSAPYYRFPLLSESREYLQKLL